MLASRFTALGASLVLALMGLAIAPGLASADDSAVTPDSGPVAGGTTVTVPAASATKFTQIASTHGNSVALTTDGSAYS